jgi:hypothetical protein
LATDDAPLVDAATIAGLLAEPERLRVVAALVLGSATVAEVRSATGLAARSVGRALARLVDTGVVVRDGEGRHWLVEDVFRQAAVAAAPTDEPASFDAPESASKVLRAFVRDGRLTAIPVQRSKRLVVLDVIAQEFEPGRRYSERQVNAKLARWHDDVASLRRYLVDEELLLRQVGGREYWRAGGTFEV